MYPLEHPLITPRLRLEPVTARLAWAARNPSAAGGWIEVLPVGGAYFAPPAAR